MRTEIVWFSFFVFGDSLFFAGEVVGVAVDGAVDGAVAVSDGFAGSLGQAEGAVVGFVAMILVMVVFTALMTGRCSRSWSDLSFSSLLLRMILFFSGQQLARVR